MSFGDRVAAAVAARGRLVAGIDPHPALLADWGLGDDADGVTTFGLICAEAFAAEVGFVKPQVAFFEQYGAAGMAALEVVIGACRAAGAVVIADAKRGDIGSTMAGYARAWLGDSPLAADAVTLSPYLGFGSLEPAISQARVSGRGVFVLARTSNPEGQQVQCGQLPGGTTHGATVAQGIVAAAREHNADGRATVGLVVGATREHGLDLTGLAGPVLAPGLGAQGATPADLPAIFGSDTQVLPSSSRQILAAGPEVGALRTAALATRDAVEAAFSQ